MKVKQILGFLRDVAANNNREWFAAHKDKYLECKADFEEGVAQLIGRIAEFDPNIAHLEPKDCCYRFYRDVRFSEDKSPYKRHFGAYICERGKKVFAPDITYIYSQAVASYPAVHIGCLLIFSRRAEMRLWAI